MGKLGDSEVIYECQSCKQEVATASACCSKKFHGSYGAAYLFNTVHNLDSGEEKMTHMTTGQHSIKAQYCQGCGKELGWLYVSAAEPSQQYKIGKAVLERNLLATRSVSDNKNKDKGEKVEKPDNASVTSAPPKANGKSRTALPAPQLYQSDFVLAAGVVLVSPATSDIGEVRVYLPDKSLPSSSKRASEALEAGALRCATAASSTASFIPSPDGREPFAVTFKTLPGKEKDRVEIMHWFLLSTKTGHPQAADVNTDWVTISDASVLCLSIKEAELAQKAAEVYHQRKVAAANGEEAVFVDGSWDLVDDGADGDDLLVEPTAGMRIA